MASPAIAAPRPFSPHDRRVALMALQVGHDDIARALRTHRVTVSRTVAGLNLGGPVAQKIARHIAHLIGKPLELVYPELDKDNAVEG